MGEGVTKDEAKANDFPCVYVEVACASMFVCLMLPSAVQVQLVWSR